MMMKWWQFDVDTNEQVKQGNQDLTVNKSSKKRDSSHYPSN